MSAALQQRPEIKIKMTVVKGPHSGQVFVLSKTSFTIGRGPENDVVLMNDPQTSRSHARVSVIDRDLEVANLSQKNAIVVDGQRVQKWKIVNNSNFLVGDSELNVEYDLGQAVVSIPTKKTVVAKPLQPLPQAQTSAPVNRGGAPVLRPQQNLGARPDPNQLRKPRQAQPMQSFNPNQPAQVRSQTAGQSEFQDASLMANPKFKFYLIILIVVGGAYFYLTSGNKNSQAKKISSTLIYGDEMTSNLNTKSQADRTQELEEKKKLQESPQKLRIQENFVRGMRDFQLGNYSRAQEFFQLVLNLDSDHALSKRYLYLSKVRFDEVVQEKLMLGETYFKKHNFRMCASLYRQVMDMLNGKSSDQKYQLAEKKAKECELASEGIR
jgi:pSer/pThr/pTyr-binding forkhead associated (FHA) protein